MVKVMKKTVVIGFGLLMAVSSAQAGLYRWVDDAGNVHFSDKVPAAASKKSHAKLSKSGNVTKRVDPESKKKSLELKQAELREQEKAAEMQRIKAQARAVIQQRDDNLLSTYADEKELVHYFETKIKMVEGNSNILKAQKNVLKKKIVKLEDRATKTKHKKSLDSIANKIVHINQTLEQYDKALIENKTQISQLNETFKTDLARYKELTKK